MGRSAAVIVLLLMLPVGVAFGQGTPLVSGQSCGGDLGGTFPNCSVDDDSHTHTSSTVTPAGIGAESVSSNAIDPDRLTGDTVDDDLIDAVIIGDLSAIYQPLIEAITDIPSGLKSGIDATLITGTAGTSGNCAEWDTNGDLVDAGAACGTSGTGDVVGPASATDNAVARYDTTTGKLIQGSGVTIDDSDVLTAPGGFVSGGATAGQTRYGEATANGIGGVLVGVSGDIANSDKDCKYSGTDPVIPANCVAVMPVTQGGTGRTTGTTAYALLATGTTATGTQQTLANGATTEVLIGGGASALPVWTTATGSGAPVRATSPTLVTPALGTPSALVATNATGTAAGLTAGTATRLVSMSETFTILEPDLVQPVEDILVLKHVNAETYASGITITDIIIDTSATCTDTVALLERANNGTSWSTSATIESITLSGTRTEDDGALSDSAIAADNYVAIDLDGTSPCNVGFMIVTIRFTVN